MKKLIIIPTYNEKENIRQLVEEVLAACPDVHILVVDDNSPDGTGAIVEAMASRSDQVHLLRREKKAGLGRAYIAGFKWGLDRDYDVLMEMDADFSHRPAHLAAFFEAIRSHDVVVGSRWVVGGGTPSWPRARILLSRFGSLYSRLILGVPVKDMTTGFVCYRREVLEKIGLNGILSDGYCFQIEMKYRALQKGFRIVETPIVFTDRKAGNSKMSQRIVIEALLRVWGLRFSKSSSAE